MLDQRIIRIERADPKVDPELPPDEPQEPFPWLLLVVVVIVALGVALIIERG
ncbi:MAG: hypothetical protein DDT30_02065 [Dehalococcoidia bacterium]|nr:hypothetical protein [Bacillota bacterium]MBT9144092.1 hypothetical protein [Bacillota bacterium]